MRGLFHRTWFKILAVALSLSLVAAGAALVFSGTGGSLRGLPETVSRPFLRLFLEVEAKLRQGKEDLKGIQALRDERDAWAKQGAALEKTARTGELAQAENARLRALLDLPKAGQHLTLASAWVIARTPDNWQGEVTLDQGRAQKVAAGQCVIDENGALVGRVKEVGKHWAVVTLVCDPALSLAGQGVSSGVLGAVEGRTDLLPKGETSFSCLTAADPVQAGERVVTFAAGENYPSGLLVGTVRQIVDDPGGLTRAAIVEPAADLNNLGQVFVVTDFWEVR